MRLFIDTLLFKHIPEPGMTLRIVSPVASVMTTRLRQVSASSLFELPFYNPSSSAARITCPVLILAASHDNLCPIQIALELPNLNPLVRVFPIAVGERCYYLKKGGRVLNLVYSSLRDLRAQGVSRCHGIIFGGTVAARRKRSSLSLEYGIYE